MEPFSPWVYYQWLWNSRKLTTSLTDQLPVLHFVSSRIIDIPKSILVFLVSIPSVSINWHLVLWAASHMISQVIGVDCRGPWGYTAGDNSCSVGHPRSKMNDSLMGNPTWKSHEVTDCKWRVVSMCSFSLVPLHSFPNNSFGCFPTTCVLISCKYFIYWAHM